MGTHSRTGSCRTERAGAFLAARGYWPVPQLVQWMATLHCGLRCEHCLAVSAESGFGDMPLETVKHLIGQVAEMGVSEFLVTGGEPLVREDLGEVIDYLGRKQVNWTLNTAAFPDATLRAAIARHAPGFVAVSLDGPEAVHDRFRGKVGAWREAREAIRFFKSIPSVQVCAGTTVTARNYDYLEETFHLAVASGADQWGIHLLVPEGRAAQRRDLFLSKTQLKSLIKFVAKKRRYFRVTMADEIGYLGSLEPLVRDYPLRCGAGTAQCVILPDGSVVPCTTLDRASSAGNVYERSLADIWAHGFEEIRAWRPEGKCQHCDYAVACRGGCWLQRKAGTQCFKNVWHVPGVLKTAAGVALCLGTLAASSGTPVKAEAPIPDGLEDYSSAMQTEDEGRSRGGVVTCSINLDEAIVNAYAERAAGMEPYSLVDPFDPSVCTDVAVEFFYRFYEGNLPAEIDERCALVHRVLGTEKISLSLGALLWRSIQEPLFDAGLDQAYTTEQRQLILEALAALKNKVDIWQLTTFEYYLDPYLVNGRWISDRFAVGKSGQPAPGELERWCLSKDTSKERWGVGEDPDTREAALAYLLEHPYASQMDLVFQLADVGALMIHSGNESRYIDPSAESLGQESYTMGIYDVIHTYESVHLRFELKGSFRLVGPFDNVPQAFLEDTGANEDTSKTVSVVLESDRDYTYVEILNAIYDANRFALAAMAANWMVEQPISMWGQDEEVVVAVHQNGPLLWPALREARQAGGFQTIGPRRSAPGQPNIVLDEETLRRVFLKDLDFWMF